MNNIIHTALDELTSQKLDADDAQLERLTSYLPAEISNRAVLGRDVMEAVWKDMESAQLPSWIGSAPARWGTTERGKLSADQWRTICTIHLPITLICLWGQENGRKQELLHNFMELVSAVRIANMRVSSKNQIDAYNAHIFRYAAGLKALFPDEKLRPSHHAALHIGDMLDLFGPVHSHSAPFFERYINFLHHVNTNQKLGMYRRISIASTPD